VNYLKMSEKKNDKVSAALRNEGNVLYHQRKFYEALLKYNESLCYAENGSQNVAFAYANRSAVYFEMKHFQEAQLNIRLALEFKYPPEKRHVLTERLEKAACKTKIDEPDVPLEHFKLSYPDHKTLPNIAECLELATDEKYGRHIITNRDLKPGDVLVIEEAFLTTKYLKTRERTTKEICYQFCSHCLNVNKMSLMPC